MRTRGHPRHLVLRRVRPAVNIQNQRRLEAMRTASPPSPSSERTRRYRQRRRRGTRCVTVEMNDVEITTLVTKGYLHEEAKSDSQSIKSAIETLISDLAFELEQQAFEANGSRS